ncbi:hypothetical protein ABVV53_17055 [Novosphingobium sp. RD2P27]|uniref:Uncharacterized protein n=1 Tax=Novosphingobium kalidii TaxID=3230299 RepID=A0ABV2D5R3_9SPHN
MATAKTTATGERQPLRWRRNLALLVLVLALGTVAYFWARMRESALTSSAYAAQTACLCRFAAGRSLQACEGDPGITRPWVTFDEDPSTHSITAGVPGVASQTARWSRESGCMLEPWRD